MMVRVYDMPAPGEFKLRATCNLHKCFPADSRDEDGNSEFLTAMQQLMKAGRYWAGGGAAPLVLLVRHGDEQ